MKPNLLHGPTLPVVLGCSRSVTTLASTSSSGTGKHIPTLGDLCKGQMIAYQRDKKKAPAIGLIDEPCGKKKWKVTTVSYAAAIATPNASSC